MRHREIHNRSGRRRKTVVLCLGFLQGPLSQYHPVLCHLQALSCGSLLYDPQNRVAHPTYKQPSREPVKPLIEFGMSADGPQMYHNETSCMHTIEQVQAEPGVVHRGWSRTKSPISGRGKRSSLERRLIWLRKAKDFQVSVRVGFSPGSIAAISWGRTDTWALSAQGRGSRS